NNSGAVVNHFVYDSFGQVISESNPAIDTRYLFTGREFDQEIGLYYYRARYYDASTGRFLSEDPIAFNGGDANLYRYVMNDPVAKTDSTGLIWDTIADIGFILYDLYRIGKYNIFGNCDNLGENLTSLGLDAAGTLIPFATGLGAAGRAATHADDIVRGGAASAANAKRLKNQLIGQEIAGGHAFEKHILNRGEFPGIRTRQQFSQHIENVVNHPTASKQLSNGRTAYWDDASGTVVIRNPKASDGGTAFQPTSGKSYFDNLR
ncbi:MAG: RHS repeat-associated core domain-containing protein, partial [Dolichospermum sp.]